LILQTDPLDTQKQRKPPVLQVGAAKESNPTKNFIGRMLNSQNTKFLNRTEEKELVRLAQAGDRASRNRIMEANLRFVMKVAYNYVGRGVEVEDLFQEGAIALDRAIDGFDSSMGLKFITYAVWWIRQHILLAISSQGRSYALPPQAAVIAHQLDTCSSSLAQKLGRLPNSEELGKKIGIGRKKVELWKTALFGTVSIDAEAGPEMDAARAQFLEDRNSEPTDYAAECSSEYRYLKKIMRALPKKDAQILDSYYRLGMTLEEIGNKMNLTRERVRQIKAQTLGRAKVKAKLILSTAPSCF